MATSQLSNPSSRLEGDVIGNRQKTFQPSDEENNGREGVHLPHSKTRVTDTMQQERDLLMNTCRHKIPTSHLLNQAHRPRERGNH